MDSDKLLPRLWGGWAWGSGMMRFEVGVILYGDVFTMGLSRWV